MASLPILLHAATTRLHEVLRQHAYAEMHHIAGSWFPEGHTVRKPSMPQEALRIDFAVPREHRLIWASRRIGQLPY